LYISQIKSFADTNVAKQHPAMFSTLIF